MPENDQAQFQNGKRPWTPEEDTLLFQWQTFYGNKWSLVAKHIPGRTGPQVCQRWRHKVNPNITHVPWTDEQDINLMSLVERIGKHWAAIAHHLPGRTDQQCLGRWRRYLDPSIFKGEWTKEEDVHLLSMHSELGNQWSTIAKTLPGRNSQQCRGRYVQLRNKTYGPPGKSHSPLKTTCFGSRASASSLLRSSIVRGSHENATSGLPSNAPPASIAALNSTASDADAMEMDNDSGSHVQLTATNDVNSASFSTWKWQPCNKPRLEAQQLSAAAHRTSDATAMVAAAAAPATVKVAMLKALIARIPLPPSGSDAAGADKAMGEDALQVEGESPVEMEHRIVLPAMNELREQCQYDGPLETSQMAYSEYAPAHVAFPQQHNVGQQVLMMAPATTALPLHVKFDLADNSLQPMQSIAVGTNHAAQLSPTVPTHTTKNMNRTMQLATKQHSAHALGFDHHQHNNSHSHAPSAPAMVSVASQFWQMGTSMNCPLMGLPIQSPVRQQTFPTQVQSAAYATPGKAVMPHSQEQERMNIVPNCASWPVFNGTVPPPMMQSGAWPVPGTCVVWVPSPAPRVRNVMQ